MSRLVPLFFLLLVGFVTGCSKPAATTSTEKTAEPKAAPKTKTSKSKTSSDKSAGVRVDVDGRKWIGDIPYDVFFDDPLGVAANTQAVPMAPGDTPSPTTPEKTTPPSATPTAPATSAGGPDWKSLISIDQLQSEVKKVRNHLKTSLKTQGTYNGNYETLRIDGAVLSAIAGIVSRHPEDVTWKPNARYVRDFGQELYEAAKQLGKADYDKSQAAAEKIEAIFDGSVPAGVSDPDASKTFGESAHRWGVMKRLSAAHEFLRANINSESKLKAQSEEILQEAAVLTVMSAIAADSSYESTDEDDYKKFAAELLAGSKEITQAATDVNYEKFRAGIDRAQKACQDCHASYGTE